MRGQRMVDERFALAFQATRQPRAANKLSPFPPPCHQCEPTPLLVVDLTNDHLLASKDKFTIHSKAVVCQDVELKGDITIGAGTVVHPKVSIYAIGGPIVIGSNNIIEEGAILVNRRGNPSPFSLTVPNMRTFQTERSHAHWR